MSGDDLIRALDLRPHPEGGHYREVFRSGRRVRRDDDGAERPALTSIHFLLRRGEISRWHVVGADEAWHFAAGAPLELLTWDAAGGLVRTVLGGGDGIPLAVVPAGAWQAARPLGDHALVGCTVGPGFEFEDFAFVSDLGLDAALLESRLGDAVGLL